MKPLAIDLFCGLGGWTEGLLAEGWRCRGYDIEAHEYGDDRYPGEFVLRDILELHGSEVADADLIVSSSPCQEFSFRAMPFSAAKALGPPELGMRLFQAQFRIQREASEAAGRHIPMIVENVRGAQAWIGAARANYGSYYLWGDVPALLPRAGLDGRKAPGKGDCFSTYGTGWPRDFPHGSKARKAASARIAKIPLTLSSHIARVFHPSMARAA